MGDACSETGIEVNYAYIAAGNSGLKVPDISNPANAEVIGTYPDPADGADQTITKSWGVTVSPGDPDYIASFDNSADDQVYFVYDMGFALFTGDDDELLNIQSNMTKNVGDWQYGHYFIIDLVPEAE